MTGTWIALDAMGGDSGPGVVVPAALSVLEMYPALRLFLVGDRTLIEKELKHWGKSENPRLKIQEASEVVLMDELPSLALRRKKDSSMRVAISLVKQGLAHACVSAGNTGALMAIARFVLKTLPGVDRPAIVSTLPTMNGPVHMLDLGANVDCDAEHLLQFAVMGSVLANAVDDNPKPRVALLNLGSEAIKGSEQVKKAAELLSNTSDVHYVGFVEGDDIYRGVADVIVCDGFVGNVALKASEGVAKLIFKFCKEAFSKNIYTKFAAFIAQPILRSLSKLFDPALYNGASLLGLQGIVIKSHGGADRTAFESAIRVAMREIEQNVPEKIHQKVAALLTKE